MSARDLDPADRLVPAPRRGRGRRPSGQVRAEILAAAGRLLLSEGMAGFTIERVAALAGASKMTIYKWWPSKGVLALEAYALGVDASLAIPHTGDLSADLITNLRNFVRLLSDSPAGPVFAELIGAAQTDPELAAELQRSYTGPRRAVGIARLTDARARGKIRPDADPEVLVDQLWGACLYRLLMANDPLTEEFVVTLVTNVMHGIRVEIA